MIKGSSGGSEVQHAWGEVPLPDTLQWVAFYSDVEPEIRPVTTGHRWGSQGVTFVA